MPIDDLLALEDQIFEDHAVSSTTFSGGCRSRRSGYGLRPVTIE